ncbi:MAG: hypothetical protein WC759_00020 [Candidatus Micrarchaeia archaeon]|jgi:hypothetical protein
MELKSEDWTLEYLQKLFGDSYHIKLDSFKNSVHTHFSVRKRSDDKYGISYSKWTGTYNYIVGRVHFHGKQHGMMVYGLQDLKEVYSDEEMVKQAKKVLDVPL